MPPTNFLSKDMCRLILFVAVLLLAVPTASHAQAKPTADRVYGISGFATGGAAHTDFGPGGSSLAAGGDFTFYPHFLRFFEPSLEARYMYANGATATEDSFQGGLKLGKNWGRLHPYGDLLVGYAVIHFKNPNPDYTHDNAIMFVPGGGFDYDLLGQFSLRADFQGQFWRDIGKDYHGLTPRFYTIGISYALPARAFRSEK